MTADRDDKTTRLLLSAKLSKEVPPTGFLMISVRGVELAVDVLCTDILILGITLIHYFHVFMIHGLSLSLVDLLLLFNILSTGMFSSYYIVSHVNIIMLVYLVRFPFL